MLECCVQSVLDGSCQTADADADADADAPLPASKPAPAPPLAAAPDSGGVAPQLEVPAALEALLCVNDNHAFGGDGSIESAIAAAWPLDGCAVAGGDLEAGQAAGHMAALLPAMMPMFAKIGPADSGSGDGGSGGVREAGFMSVEAVRARMMEGIHLMPSLEEPRSVGRGEARGGARARVHQDPTGPLWASKCV
jgi:hypothetical protein